jgi:hypothetical protein
MFSTVNLPKQAPITFSVTPKAKHTLSIFLIAQNKLTAPLKIN